MEQFDQVETLFYFDPDVLILSPWVFFREWVTRGVGLVMDCNAPIVPSNHPWRFKWRELAAPAAEPRNAKASEPFYANSGFFCLGRQHRGFLDLWKAITDRFEGAGGDTRSFHLDQRWRAVTGDQDLLAATTEAWEGPLSYVGPDGMGFNGHYWLLSHATERPKPWRRICIREALKGHPPERTVGIYLDCANGAVRTLSQLSHLLRSLDYRLGRGIGCYWRRP